MVEKHRRTDTLDRMGSARIIALGGAGAYGRGTTQSLAASVQVGEIVIAGRDIDAARAQAERLGAKARAAQVDLSDPGRLAELAEGAALIVNTAGPETAAVLPALREAIAAGVDYCDLCADASTTAAALSLDGRARERGVTALLGIGEFPGLSNLMMLHAASQLDVVDAVRHCVFIPAALDGPPRDVLARWRSQGRVEASWQLIMHLLGGGARVFEDGSLLVVDPSEGRVSITLWPGFAASVYPVGLPEPVTIPRRLPEVRSVESLWAFHPPDVNDAYLSLGARVSRGELDEPTAATELFEHLTTLPKESLVPPAGQPAALFTWAEAAGARRGRPARSRCWRRRDWPTTEYFLATAALRILRGDIRRRGVLSPESCLEPLPFFSEVIHRAGLDASLSDLLGTSIDARE